MGRLILIRHCETDSNASGLVQGRRDLPLSSRGRRQATLVADHVKQNHTIDQVITSDRSRCVETSNAISDSAMPTPLLRELDFGDWEGQKWSTIRSNYPDDFERILKMDPDFAPPGGEKISGQIDRVEQAAYEYDLANSPDLIAVVAHDGILRSLIALLLGWNTENMNNMSLFNGSVSEITTGAAAPKLELLNHYQHVSSTYEESNLI